METEEVLAQDPSTASARGIAEVIARSTGLEQHDTAIILGSGWDAVADQLGHVDHTFKVTDFADFLPPSVEGHGGKIQSVRCGNDRHLLVFRGRTHLYEKDAATGEFATVDQAIHRVRVAAAAKCTSIVLTSAVGGLRPHWLPDGTAAFVSDHISFFVPSPLSGPNFLQCHEIYSSRLQEICREHGLDLNRAVLGQLKGPHFETPAEVKALQFMGADMVGMSVVIEAIEAVFRGMEVLGISIVTDQAGTKTSHNDVLACVRETAGRIAPQLANAIVQF